nr:serine hydrolase domain-containing protein [Cytobacillus eiseniae]
MFGYATKPVFSATEQQRLENKLIDFMTKHENTAAGVATIAVSEDEIIYKMKGYADIEKQTRVDEETVFEWGSVSKILIWISVLQLVEDEKLALEMDIKTYLPHDFRLKTSFDTPVTLQHLMNHTAGFDDSYTDLMIYHPTKIPSLREALEAADIKQVFPPGQFVAYSNYGASLAAYIVEEVSGLDYREYIQKHIFDPLHMTKTAIDPEQNDNQWVKEQRQKVQGYTEDLQLIEPNHYVIPMYPSGGVMGVASDLQKLLQALLAEDGTPLFKHHNTIDFLFKPSLYYPESSIPRIANGLFFLPSASEQVFGHGGNTISFSSSIYLDRVERIGVLVLTNMANESTFTLRIPEIIFGNYTHIGNHTNLENSSEWNGIYEPARVPRHGFSKVYGLFLRSKAKQTGSHDLMMNDFYYSQAEPNIYITEDDFSGYALDVYSKHPETKKILSSVHTDLLYVPFYKHFLEWGLMILGVFSALFSFGFMIVTVFKKLRKKQQSKLHVIQHLLNVFMFINVIWIGYKTLSMTTYSSLTPFLTANIFYMAISFVISGYLLFLLKNKKTYKYQTSIRIMTLISTIILCVNILYWDFYF